MARDAAPAARRILFVSLPFGPFGRRLVQALSVRGAVVHHLILNAGDLASRRGPGGRIYRHGPTAFASDLPNLVAGYTDVVVFGESGPYNQAVLDNQAMLAGSERPLPRIWVLENGYFRPDWITLERGGANAGSHLPRSRAGYAEEWPAPPPPLSVGPAVRNLTFNISAYYLIELLGRPLFPNHAPAFTVAPWRQAVAHTRRYLRGILVPGTDDASAGPPAYFLVCLQRDGDSQLLRHSDLPGNAAFLEAVLTSFAKSAPPDVHLVVKNHPLDSGQIDLAALTRAAAKRHGLGERVDFIEGGSLAQLCRNSRGLVVNNSSSAFSALGFGTPVKALGRALFDFEGLADPQSLDGFWNAPVPPDPDLFRRFRAQVMARTQINGSFDAPAMIGSTADAVADAILTGHCGQIEASRGE